MELSQPLIDGRKSLEHLYYRFRNWDTAEVVVFAFPKRVGHTRAMEAGYALLEPSGRWMYIEEPDGYGNPLKPKGGFDHLKGGRCPWEDQTGGHRNDCPTCESPCA